MRKFGLIGHPIGHSLSPALFKAGYDGRYTYDLIETPDFEEAYRRFLDGYDGINVTAPFKELALRKADIISEECQKIGATNLMVKTPEGIKAYNSDYRGLRSLLSGMGNASRATRALIVGCGGASKALLEIQLAGLFLQLPQALRQAVVDIGLDRGIGCCGAEDRFTLHIHSGQFGICTAKVNE